MRLSFLTPFASVVALAGIAPLAAFLRVELQGRRVRARLRLPEPQQRSRLPLAAAICGVALLLALAAAQPVVEHTTTRHVRGDAEALFVFDTSRSMLAAVGPGGPTRFSRAKAAAARLRASLSDVPVGISSLTDQTLPHLMPSSDRRAFAATLERALGVERPAPSQPFANRATTLGALSAVPRRNFFSPSAARRLLVVFTDGESRPFSDPGIAAAFRRPPGVATIFVRFWSQDERVFSAANVPEAAYRPDPASKATVARLAALTRGHAFSEDELGEAAGAARQLLGEGVEVSQRHRRRTVALAPYLTVGIFVPLAFLLRRRNF